MKKYNNTSACAARHQQPFAAMCDSDRLQQRNECVLQSVDTHRVISTSLPCFKGVCCWFGCYFWQPDWLVGTSLAQTPESWNAKGTAMSTLSVSSWKQSEVCSEAGAPRLFSPESSRPAVPLSHSHTPLPRPPASSFLSLGSRLWTSAGPVSVAGGSLTPTSLKQTTFHLFDL